MRRAPASGPAWEYTVTDTEPAHLRATTEAAIARIRQLGAVSAIKPTHSGRRLTGYVITYHAPVQIESTEDLEA